MVSARTSPHTPAELVYRSPPQSFPLPFGRAFMVKTFDDQRTLYATKNATYRKVSPKMELGICMGPDPISGTTFFLLRNGHIVPRKCSELLPSLIPWDW
jgi:hypothetical protein